MYAQSLSPNQVSLDHLKRRRQFISIILIFSYRQARARFNDQRPFSTFPLRWNPKHLDIWANPHGHPYVLGTAKDCIPPLLYDIIDGYNDLQCERASRHYDGKGIELGVEWSSTLSITYTMRRSKTQWVTCLLAALETVMAGASWPQARVGDISQDVQPTCLLCGVPIGDSLHVSWNCPCVNAFDDEAISKTTILRIWQMKRLPFTPAIGSEELCPKH